jgi:hypothetical protein
MFCRRIFPFPMRYPHGFTILRDAESSSSGSSIFSTLAAEVVGMMFGSVVDRLVLLSIDPRPRVGEQVVSPDLSTIF